MVDALLNIKRIVLLKHGWMGVMKIRSEHAAELAGVGHRSNCWMGLHRVRYTTDLNCVYLGIKSRPLKRMYAAWLPVKSQ